eukprot:scaffold1034_cov175-Ochromonas_danica.AAC.7
MTAERWYNKRYYGAEAQKMWQIGAGLGSLLLFVVMPVWLQYWSDKHKMKKMDIASNAKLRDDLQRQVYELRLSYRKKLADGTLELPATPPKV